LSHQTLGDMLGLRRETVTLHLARLRSAGALDVVGQEFLLNLGRLAEVCDGGTSGIAVLLQGDRAPTSSWP
ncbi:MAG: winged helix-turn-helix domain-containing protein, partial [Candidatus Dormibacteraeota bacterium]|nr:winged helix-turn-helix domain-containing protein [Candidatus Dormibacteraeota bacterium]